MDRKEALNIFVKSNIKLLLLEKFPANHFKRLKLDYFLDRTKKYIGVPKNKEIADVAINFLINNGVINNDGELSNTLALPFFAKYINNDEIFRETLALRNSTISTVDVRKLSDSMIKDRIKHEIQKEVIEESTVEIQKAIEEKRREYSLIPSILDGDEYEEPVVIESNEEQPDQFRPWWQKLGLKSDPFPEQEGLACITKDMYEDVVFKTPIFEKFVSLTKECPTELFKNRIFFGEFGSGKTTLFDYLTKPLNNIKIYNIYIQLYAEQDFQSILVRFRDKLFDGLCDIFELLYESNPREWIKSTDKQNNIQELLDKLVSKDGLLGLIVFIDDLHKNSDETEVALKFINNLQILRGELIRSNQNLNIAFFIAGSMQWKNALENDPKYSGSYAKYEVMPIISPESANAMLNKRLLAFAVNPESIREIDLRYVKKIYRGLQNDEQPVTFRSFIKAALSEFDKGNFSILTADPVKISEERIEEIKEIIESNNVLNERFNNLLFGGGIQNIANREKTLKLLVKTHLEKELPETSKIIHDNKFEFQRLARSGLIQKVKNVDGLKWVVCKELVAQNELISKKFNLYLEDYLVKAYVKSKVIKKQKKGDIIVQKLKSLDVLIKKIKNKETKSLLKATRDEHERILRQLEQFETKTHPTELINDCVANLVILTKTISSFFEVETPFEENQSIFLREFYRDFWFSPGSIAEFINQISDLENNTKKIWYICALYQEVFNEIINLLTQEIEDAKSFKIPLANLSNEEINSFREIRTNWANSEYFEVAEITTQLFESKIKKFLYNIFTILYGDRFNRLKRLDPSSSDYIQKNISETKSKGFNVSRNELEQLNRGNFKNFMVGTFDKKIGEMNWHQLFSKIFHPITEKEITEFLSIFADINIIVSHRKKESFSSENQSTLFNYILRTFELIKKMNLAYHTLIQEGFFVEDSGVSLKFRFSFCTLDDIDFLEPIRVTQNTAQRVFDTLKRHESRFAINLEDKNTLEARFHTAYREVYAILARLITQTKPQIMQTGIKVTIIKIKGSSVTITIQESKSSAS